MADTISALDYDLLEHHCNTRCIIVNLVIKT